MITSIETIINVISIGDCKKIERIGLSNIIPPKKPNIAIPIIAPLLNPSSAFLYSVSLFKYLYQFAKDIIIYGVTHKLNKPKVITDSKSQPIKLTDKA